MLWVMVCAQVFPGLQGWCQRVPALGWAAETRNTWVGCVARPGVRLGVEFDCKGTLIGQSAADHLESWYVQRCWSVVMV